MGILFLLASPPGLYTLRLYHLWTPECGLRFTFRFAEALKKDGDFVFTCLTTRAVHLEIVSSLDTSSCVMGIERFIARHGTPSTIWSDNGRNFVGAEKELLACIKSWNGMAPNIFAHKAVTWKFNLPGAPHHGGSWERLVRSVKRVLYDFLGSRRVTEEVLEQHSA